LQKRKKLLANACWAWSTGLIRLRSKANRARQIAPTGFLGAANVAHLDPGIQFGDGVGDNIVELIQLLPRSRDLLI
jgi:hypothetical protein